MEIIMSVVTVVFWQSTNDGFGLSVTSDHPGSCCGFFLIKGDHFLVHGKKSYLGLQGAYQGL